MQTNEDAWFNRFFPIGQDRAVWRMVLLVFTISIVIQVIIMTLQWKIGIHAGNAAIIFSILGALWIWNLSEKSQNETIPVVSNKDVEALSVSRMNTDPQRKNYAAGRR